MRREGRVTVQGPVKKQQPDGMSHGGQFQPLSPGSEAKAFLAVISDGKECRLFWSEWTVVTDLHGPERVPCGAHMYTVVGVVTGAGQPEGKRMSDHPSSNTSDERCPSSGVKVFKKGPVWVQRLTRQPTAPATTCEHAPAGELLMQPPLLFPRKAPETA